MMNNLKPMRIRSIPADIDGQIIHISEEDDRKLFYLVDNSLLYLKCGPKKHLLYDAVENLIRIEYMHGLDKISLVTSNRLVIIDCVSRDCHINRFDEDIVDISWNHNYDYFTALFANDNIKTYIFTPTLECLVHGSGSLHASVPELNTVGWGSESTQFQINRSEEDTVEESAHIPPTDNKKPTISWAENKLEFVISYIDDDVRKFKIFDHLCLPKIASKLCEGELYGPVAWKPHGCIIATAVFYNAKNCILFFEQNGLSRHILPLEQIPFPITHLSWSTCGSVLSVTQEDDSKQRHISLYAGSNFRWYLKQHMIFHEDNLLYKSTWLVTSPKYVELLVVARRQIVQYKYRFEFQRDCCHKTIATIDGKNLMFYNFMESITPPPTCYASLQFSNAINMIEFHAKNEIMAAIDDSNCIYIVSTQTNVHVVNITFLYEQIFPLNVNHLFWRMDCPNVIIDNNMPDHKVSLYEFDTAEKRLIEKQDLELTSNDIEEIVCGDDIIIVYGGNKRRVYYSDNTPVVTHFEKNPLQVIPFTCDQQMYCFILTTDRELYVEDNLVSRGITSIMIYSRYLLFTDDSALYTIELNSVNISHLPTGGLDQCHKRPLNEVMYIVGMTGNATSTILYTPRGTLDIVSSLPLEINYINFKIEEESWEEVIYFMRLFKMNWNLLIDLNSSKFYSNFEKIITICHRRGVLNALIDEISNQNVGNFRNAVAVIPPPHLLEKKQVFFERLDSLFAHNGAYCQYFPTVMKICLDQANLNKAMLYASNLLKVSEYLLEKAIKLLKIRVEATDLFNAALQTFDLELAAFVAMQCQMNPQEVDPILDQLRGLTELDKRSAIHLRFRQWEKALPYMLRSSTYQKETILIHIKTYDLSKTAYNEAVTLDLPYLKEIILLYVEKLARARLYKEAAVLCAQHRMLEEALELFKYSLDHLKCIEYLALTQLGPDSKKDFLKDLAQRLVLGGRINEAAIIYEEHLDDPASAVKTLLEGKMFTSALRVARAHKMRELIVTEVIPQLLKRMSAIVHIIEQNRVKFMSYARRLKELRYKKKVQMSQIHLGSVGILNSIPLGNANNRFSHPDVDMESIITFGSSVSSSSSSSSRKMLRKLERQKQDTTMGSRFEDIALIREMHIILTTVFQFGDELRESFLVLVEISLLQMKVLREYQNKLLSAQQKMEEEVKLIWNDDFKIDSTLKYMSENISYLDEKYRTPPPEVSCPGSSWALEILK